jgi:hypothetical protein
MVAVLCDFYVLTFFRGHSLQWCDRNKHGRVWHVWHKNVPNLIVSPQLHMASCCATLVLYSASLVFPSSGIGPLSATGTKYRVKFCARSAVCHGYIVGLRAIQTPTLLCIAFLSRPPPLRNGTNFSINIQQWHCQVSLSPPRYSCATLIHAVRLCSSCQLRQCLWNSEMV